MNDTAKPTREEVRDRWEILVGGAQALDALASRFLIEESPHPLQDVIEEIIETQLTEDEQEIYYMRFGERLPIRTIARRLGYVSHQTIQVKLQRIQDKVKIALEAK